MSNHEALKESLYSLEKRLLQPEVRRNAAAVCEMLADDFIEFGSSGTVYDKQAIVEELRKEHTIRFSILDFEVISLAPDVALTTYRVVAIDQEAESSACSLRSSVWKLIGGRWQIVFHQGTPAEA